MHPNADEIAAAKRVLADAGYLCVHIEPLATWTMDTGNEIDGSGIAVELTPDERNSALRQMKKIKAAYGCNVD